MIKKIIYKVIILIGLTLFAYYIFIHFRNIYYINKQKCQCEKNNMYVGRVSFYINGILGNNLENAKVIVYAKGSNFKKVIDNTNLELLETDVYYDDKKNVYTKSETNKSLKNVVNFNKLITVNADWIIVLNNNKKLKISNIKTRLNRHSNMFEYSYYCEVGSLKINGVQNDTLITGLSE